MSMEMTLAIISTAISVGAVLVGMLKVARLIGQSDTQIKADVQSVKEDVKRIGDLAASKIVEFRESTTKDLTSLAASTSASMTRLETTTRDTIAHQTEMAQMRHQDLSNRVGRIESTLGSITKVVVFTGDKPA